MCCLVFYFQVLVKDSAMNPKFKIGEIAVNCSKRPSHGLEKYVGQDVEIMSAPFQSLHYNQNPYYKVKASDGVIFNSAERILKKKKPPENAREWFNKNIKINTMPVHTINCRCEVDKIKE